MYYSATPKCVKAKNEICKRKVILFGHNTPSDHIFAHFLLHIFGSDPVNAKMNQKNYTFEFALTHYLGHQKNLVKTNVQSHNVSIKNDCNFTHYTFHLHISLHLGHLIIIAIIKIRISFTFHNKTLFWYPQLIVIDYG